MRELRFRRTGLVKAFARSMDRYRGLWFDQDESLERIAQPARNWIN